MKLLKANKREQRIFKKLQIAKELLEGVLAYNYPYGRRREGRIAFDCKIYEWLRSDDVDAIIKESNLNASQRSLVKSEFDEYALENIGEHALQCERDSWFSWLNCDSYDTRSYVGMNMKLYTDVNKCSHPALREIIKKLKSEKSKEKAVLNFFQDGFDAINKLKFLNKDELWFAGNRCGHAAIASSDRFQENLDIVCSTVDDMFCEIDSVLNINCEEGGRNEWMRIIENDYYYERDIDNIIEEAKAILWVIGKGEDWVKNLKTGEFLRERLRYDINDFINDSIIVTTYSDDQIKEWMSGGNVPIRSNRISKSYLRIDPKDGDMVCTSQGIHINKGEALSLYKHLDRFVRSDENESMPISVGMKIGNYNVMSFNKEGDDHVLRAGCHNISFNHIQYFAKNYLGVA